MAENQETQPTQEQPVESTPSLLPRFYGSNSATKRVWLDLVALTAEEAERKIKEEMPRVEIQVIQPDCFVTMEYRQDRVRLFVDSSGKVARAPRIG